FEVRVRLRVLPVFTFKKIAQDARVALVTHERASFEVGERIAEVREIDALAVFINGRVDKIRRGGVIVGVVVTQRTFAPLAEVIVEIRPKTRPAPLAIVPVHIDVELEAKE